MKTILDYYKYSTLATAAYVHIEDRPISEFVGRADTQQRLPLTLGQYLFDANVTQYGSRDTWNILHYFRNDRASDSITAKGTGVEFFSQKAACVDLS